MYAGTGESYTGNDAKGNGIYKSTDSGLNWTKVFGNSYNDVSTIVSSNYSVVENGFFVNDIQLWINNNIEYIFAVMGQGQGGDGENYEFYDNNESGLYVSSDNGETWSEIELPSNNGLGLKDDLNDIEVDLNNKIWISTTKNIYGAPGGAFYSSIDGVNFIRTIPNYPDITSSTIGRVEFTPSSTVTNTFYVLMSAGSPAQAELFKTTDALASLTKLIEPDDADRDIYPNDFTRDQSWYDLEVEVDPNDGDIIYLGGINLFRSEDAGATWSQLSKWADHPDIGGDLNVSVVHADQHGIYFKPGDSDKGIVVNDGGGYYTTSFLSLIHI